MKLHVEESPEYGEVDVTIRCPMLDDGLRKLIEQIRLYGFSIQGRKNGQTTLIRPEELYYIESVDEKTFLYCEKEVYDCAMRLYELEQKLQTSDFFRVSKSCLMSLRHLSSFRSLMNGRMEATLENGERIEVSRHYVLPLKERLIEMGGGQK